MSTIPNLFIVGAGGFGRELYCWLKDSSEWGVAWRFAGFIDDNLSALDGFDYDAEVVSSASDFVPSRGQLFVCGIGNVEVKSKVCGPLVDEGAEFITFVHPSVVVGRNVELGAGVVVCPQVVLSCDIEIGEMVMLNLHTTVGHDARIGKWTTVSAHCDLTGSTRVGEAVFLGSGARVIPGKSVGNQAVVGAGSVVIRNVNEGQKVFGNPARVFS